MRRNAVKSRYKRKRLLYRLISIVAFFALLGGVYEAIRIVQFHMEAENLQREIEQLEIDNRELRVIEEKLKNDPAEMERRAREELGMIKEGERVYREIDPQMPDREGTEGISE